MKTTKILLSIAIVLSIAGFASAEASDDGSKVVYDFWRCASPTNGFWGLNDYLAPSGIEIGLGLTNVYHANVKGGTSTNDRKGRHVGRYDLEMSMDLEKLLGIEGGSFFVHGWGGWTDAEGIDGSSVGSAWGINALAVGNRTLDIVEAFYEGPLFSDSLTIAVGKLDFTGIFDASEYADDECCQFLNAALVDDPTIPFPAQGLGVVLNWAITDTWYLMGGAIDAQGDNRETGFRTAFHEQDYYFYALETGVTAGNGNYRVGLWNDPQPKANSDRSKNYRDDLGVYTSCDWLVYEENPSTDDGQGLGVFARYGYAPSKRNDVTNFYSAGLQYQGLIEGRDDDVCGLAYAQGEFSDTAASTYPEDYESVMEAYYNAQITPWFNLSPSVQYVANPGGSNTAKDAVI
ncbi:MAG: carbohydrate porin, partial [Planctomycetota bacterium]